MKRGSIFALSLLFTIALWLLFTWPLAQRLTTGIPSTSRNTESLDYREMIPGDHVQLLYHFWLASDMLRGETPFLHNLYEFNTGDDDKRFVPDPYYIPFSLIYAGAERLGGRAFGWNMAGLASIFISFWASWLFVRRYTRSGWTAAAAAVVAVTLPYRWTTLLVGSPTGFATALVPILFLGIDMAVRDDRPTGGLLAGLAILFAYCSDLHVFFFSALASPAWCIVAFLTRDDFEWRRGRAWAKLTGALLPTVLFGIAALAAGLWLQQNFTGTDMQDGRPLEIVARYSPARSGLVDYANTGVSNRVFVGFILPVILLLGFLAEVIDVVRNRKAGAIALRRGLFLLLVGGALVVVISLALGMNGPGGGRVLVWCRRLIPPYSMIRQPAKAFCLMPALLAVAMAIALSALTSPLLGRLRHGIVFLLLAAMVTEHKLQIDPAICGLKDSQGAYAAVARNAELHGHDPRVLIVPLWPGDSHWSSLYEHYVSLYRIRMLNGYSPVVRDDYVDNVIKRFESVNQGLVTKEQVAALQDMGVQYILLHEDAFPEKVSPHPVGFTLHGLLNSPHVKLLEQDEAVWAFRLAPRVVPRGSDEAAPVWLPARRWEAEHTACTGGAVTADDTVSRGAYRELRQDGDMFACHTRAPMVLAEGLHWMLRVRGHGSFEADVSVAEEIVAASTHMVDSDAWEWRVIHVPQPTDFALTGIDISHADGHCEFDTLLMTAGSWRPLAAGETRTLPATSFFRAGYTEADTGSVVLRADADPQGAVLYGPLLPLEAGKYRIGVDAEPGRLNTGEVLGTVAVSEGRESAVLAEISAPGRHEGVVSRPTNLPLRIEVHFTRAADLRVNSISIERL